MAMLAAPRRKQKVINLRAKNNTWSNDSNKFGQRMLEKMGWSEGKGLGANENGIVEHVVAKYKNDDKGLGYEDRNDQWTKHEDDFNSLLANLSNGVINEEKLHSGISLEVKSKKSKARVHYHKFTRGKDLTRYSEKDLANIFGKKSLKPVKPEKQKQMEQVVEIKAKEQVFTDKGSMVDYFKNKMAAFKSKNTMNINYDTDRADYAFKGFSRASNDDDFENHKISDYQECSTNNEDYKDLKESTNVENIYIEITKKTKKKKKNRNSEPEIDTKDTDRSEVSSDTVTKVLNNITKSKKIKHKSISEMPSEESIEIIKSKKNKNIYSIEEHISDEHVPMKKKKKKDKNV